MAGCSRIWLDVPDVQQRSRAVGMSQARDSDSPYWPLFTQSLSEFMLILKTFIIFIFKNHSSHCKKERKDVKWGKNFGSWNTWVLQILRTEDTIQGWQPDLLHNTGQRTSTSNFCIKPIISDWTMACSLLSLVMSLPNYYKQCFYTNNVIYIGRKYSVFSRT